ncbi:glycosyltransferase [Paraclostridium sordellii]|uniref:glycosyltransferase n=1 Tax=Paraclostridium sordellii TaxID=1505 RepID=UPI0005EA02C3|nr:glycosyltransferase [Paeniclostridium sordellii]CEP81819.1 capsular polysaccharide biosynthesis protein [[Clostridium] sordellii] [Paeniclostridium sordellii]
MAEKIRVLHLLQSGHFSGAENVACKIIEMFKNDEKFDMAYASKNGSIREVLENKNIKYYPMYKLCYKEVKKIIEEYKPDIIHAHDATASVISSIFYKKCKIISHLHSNPPWIRKFGLNSIIYLVRSFKYNKILTVSKSIMDEYVYGNIMKNKVIQINNPVNIEDIQQKSKLTFNKVTNSDLIYIGRLANPKNPLRFIKIVNKLKRDLPNIRAVMVGDGDLKYQCIELINKLHLSKNIILVGFVDNPFVLLKNSKVLCITSDWEGYGLVAVEALAIGKPVVCRSVGGLTSIVDDKCGKACNSDDEIINELKCLITKEEYLQKKSKNASARADILNNFNSYRNTIQDIYCNCI